MKWMYLLICFISTSAFSQSNNKSVLDKLKQTDRLINKTNPVIDKPNPGINKPGSGNFQRDTIVHRFNQNQQKIIIPDNIERVVIALRQDNMPCIVPNMNLFKTMPNVGSIAMLQNPIDPDIYLHKIKPPRIEKIKPSN